MSSAYYQVPLTTKTLKLVNFVIGNIQYQFVRGFYGSAGLPNFFSRLMTIYFHSEIRKGNALTYLDDVFLQARTKQEKVIREYHAILRKVNLKAAPDKTLFFLRKVEFLGHKVENNTLKPIHSKVDSIKRLKTPESKKDLMRFVGAMNFYSK